VGGFAPYPISYRAITPKRETVTNLLVPVALSATHIAFGSIRMEPVFMVLGQAAAVAASMAIDGSVPVQQIDVRELQRELRENPLADGSVPEVLVDNGYEGQVRVTGNWTAATDIPGRFGPSALKSEGKGGSVRFTAAIKVPGRYQVHLYWPRAEGLAGNVPVVIRHATGSHPLTIDMRTPSETAQGGIAQWALLGEYTFEPENEAWVEVRADGADGVVLADAVLFVPIRDRAPPQP
jgi:hypothetical protein